MKKTLEQNIALTLACFLGMATAAQAQGVFQVINGSGLGVPIYFKIDADTGQFQIDSPALPTLPDNPTALIITPAGTLTFSIGVGTPAAWDNGFGNMFPNPFIPPPTPTGGSGLAMMGTQFNGSFQSSSDVYADLLAGLGEFQIVSGPTVYLNGSMDVVAVPEPGTVALFLGGLMPLMWITYRRVCNGSRA